MPHKGSRSGWLRSECGGGGNRHGLSTCTSTTPWARVKLPRVLQPHVVNRTNTARRSGSCNSLPDAHSGELHPGHTDKQLIGVQNWVCPVAACRWLPAACPPPTPADSDAVCGWTAVAHSVWHRSTDAHKAARGAKNHTPRRCLVPTAVWRPCPCGT